MRVRTDGGLTTGGRPSPAGPLPLGGQGRPAREAPGAGEAAGTAEAPPPRRGRPRSEAAERAILDAVLHLIRGGATLAELSIEGIARQAGVGKATIYRRWPGKEALVLDALAAVEHHPPPEVTGRSVREDLVAVLESARRTGIAGRDNALMHVIAEIVRHPTLSRRYREQVLEPRRRVMRRVLRDGVEKGELRGDVDVDMIAELFAGPLFMRAVLHPWAPLDEDLPARIVDAVLDGVRAR